MAGVGWAWVDFSWARSWRTERGLGALFKAKPSRCSFVIWSKFDPWSSMLDIRVSFGDLSASFPRAPWSQRDVFFGWWFCPSPLEKHIYTLVVMGQNFPSHSFLDVMQERSFWEPIFCDASLSLGTLWLTATCGASCGPTGAVDARLVTRPLGNVSFLGHVITQIFGRT